MDEAVIAIDLGTSRIKAALFSPLGEMTRMVDAPVPEAGSVREGQEFEAEAHYHALLNLLAAISGTGDRDSPRIAAISLSSQRASIVPLAENGLPVGPALSWQDTRCGPESVRFEAAFGGRRFMGITGLPPSFLWSMSKTLWLREHRPEVWGRTRKLALLHDHVMARLGARPLVSDLSNASLTGWLDVRTLDWSDEVLDAVALDRDRLPMLVRSGTPIGGLSREASEKTGLPAGTMLIAGGGDQQCAALGLGAVEEGQAGLCLGTAAVVSCPAEKPLSEPGGTCFCTVHAADGRFVREGIVNAFGSALQWAAAALSGGDLAGLERMAGRAPIRDSSPFFLPHLAGIGSPDFDAGARGAFVGIDPCAGPDVLARAVIEGVCLEVRRVLDGLEGGSPTSVVAAGGLAQRPVIAGMLASCLGRALHISSCGEASLAGAAMLAWIGAGRYAGFGEAISAFEASRGEREVPETDGASRERRLDDYARWTRRIRPAGE